MRTSFHRLSALAAIVACLALSSAVNAEEEGSIRISDHAAAAPLAGGAPCGPAACAPGGCPDGSCGSACHDGHCGRCGRRCCLLDHLHRKGPHEHCCPLTAMLCCCDGACTHSPDHGWVRPRKHPVHRVPVTYQYYWPAKWYGQPGSAFISAYPMVYMPTDTTELGFYYQRAPYWVPKPFMLPPGPPWPPQWHNRDCPPPGGMGYFGAAGMSGMYGTYVGGAEMAIDGGLVTSAAQPGIFPDSGVPSRPLAVETADFGREIE